MAWYKMRLVCRNVVVFEQPALDYESGGQEFESLRARQHLALDFFPAGSTGEAPQMIADRNAPHSKFAYRRASLIRPGISRIEKSP
jgi:hypothetical protein